METYVSFFKGAKNPVPLNSDWTVKNAVLSMTYPDNFKDEVDRVRAAKTKEEKTEIKKTLHAITFSGHFSYRASDKLIKHSGFICMDIDDVEDLDELRQIVNNDPYTYASFTSCSGKGLAFLVKIDPQKHLDSFLAIEKYYKEFKKIKITADTSCKDVARLRFVTYDPQTYLYEKSLLWDNFEILIEKPKKVIAKKPIKNNAPEPDTSKKVVWFLENLYKQALFKMGEFLDDNGTGALTHYFSGCNAYGIPKDNAAAFLDGKGVDSTHKDFLYTMDYIYKHYASQFGTKNIS